MFWESKKVKILKAEKSQLQAEIKKLTTTNYELTRKLEKAELEKECAENNEKSAQDFLKQRHKEINKLKAQLKEKEDIFIGKTVRKLIEHTERKTEIINKYINLPRHNPFGRPFNGLF